MLLQVFHTAPLFRVHTLVAASIAPLAAADRRRTIDTDLWLSDGTYVKVRTVRDEQHAEIGYVSVKLPRDKGQDAQAVVAGFEEIIERIQPGCWLRGRCAAAKLASGMRSDDGSATSTIARLTSPCRNDPKVAPYMLMENKGTNKAKLDQVLLGAELVARGMRVKRCLVFLGVCIRKALIHIVVLR